MCVCVQGSLDNMYTAHTTSPVTLYTFYVNIISINLQGAYYYDSSFTNEETMVRRGRKYEVSKGQSQDSKLSHWTLPALYVLSTHVRAAPSSDVQLLDRCLAVPLQVRD